MAQTYASIVGLNSGGLVVQGSYGIELYIKGSTDYYRLTCLYYPKLSDSNVSRVYSNDLIETQNLFEFVLLPKAGEVGAPTNPSDLSYDELFTYEDETDFTGSEIYIRNDSPLHRYLSNFGYSEYINVLKPYLYLGKLYPKDSSNNIISIETYFMKDYVVDALPEHQRTDNVREFLGVAFDQLYTQQYYKFRDILRQSDPDEMKNEYLQYLLETFGTTSIIPVGENTWDLDRFFIRNLPALLKRKGAYSAIYGIFRFLTNTTNRLNIYEQWHEKISEGAPYDYESIQDYCESNNNVWQEHLWDEYYIGTVTTSTSAELNLGIKNFVTNEIFDTSVGKYISLKYDTSNYMEGTVLAYDVGTKSLSADITSVVGRGIYDSWTISFPITAGCGKRFYSDINPYPTKDDDPLLISSPHYRIEMDLSTEPLRQYQIIDSGIANVIMDKFEELRPVSKFCVYSTLMKMVTDFSGQYLDTYNGLYFAYCKTKCLIPIYPPLQGCFIFYSRSLTKTTIRIFHELGTEDILVQTYYDTGEAYKPPYTRFYPADIKILDKNNVEITLSEPISFYAFIVGVVNGQGDVATDIPKEDLPIATLTGSTEQTGFWTVWNRKIDTGYEHEIIPATYSTLPVLAGGNHVVEIAPSGSNDEYREVTIHCDTTYGAVNYFSTPILPSGSTEYSIEHGLGTTAVIIDVFEVIPSGSDNYLKKFMPTEIVIVDEDNIYVLTDDNTKKIRIFVKRLTDTPFIRFRSDIVQDINYVVLGNGTGSWSPTITTSGSMQSPIPSSSYVLKDVIVYDRNLTDDAGGYDTFNVKIVIDILNDINITEVGLYNIDNNMLFYSRCSDIFVLEGNQLNFYYEIRPKTTL